MPNIVRLVANLFQSKEAIAVQRRREQLVLAYRTESVIGHALLDAQSPRKGSKRLFCLCNLIQNGSIELCDLADIPLPSGPWMERENSDCLIHCQRLESLLGEMLTEVQILKTRFIPRCTVKVIDVHKLDNPDNVKTDNIRGRLFQLSHGRVPKDATPDKFDGLPK